MLSIHIYEFIFEFIYEFTEFIFKHEIIYEFTCVSMNSYMNPYVKILLTAHFLVHPKSYGFFMNSYMNS